MLIRLLEITSIQASFWNFPLSYLIFALGGEMKKVNFIGCHKIAPAILQEEKPR